MATRFADLMVRIGADIKGFNEGLSQVKANTRSVADAMGNLNRSASTIATGVTAGAFRQLSTDLSVVTRAIQGTVQAAAQLDAMKRALTAVTGSAAEAERQFARLKEVAKLPGIAFKEAIEGSVRLQAAGFNAGLAERALRAFGNALATVGRGGAELDRVNLVLGQIINKPQVMQQDLNQMRETLPQISQAMQDAFGTRTAEGIRDLGISGKEFVERIIAQFEKLPQVTGGIGNDIENLKDQFFRVSAEIGKAFVPAARSLLAAAEPLLETIAGLAHSFTILPQPIQTAGLALVGFVVAAQQAAGLAASFINLNNALGGISLAAIGAKAGLAALFIAGGAAAIQQTANAFQTLHDRLDRDIETWKRTEAAIRLAKGEVLSLADALEKPKPSAELLKLLDRMRNPSGWTTTELLPIDKWRTQLNILSRTRPLQESFQLLDVKSQAQIDKQVASLRAALEDIQRLGTPIEIAQATKEYNEQLKKLGFTLDDVKEKHREALSPSQMLELTKKTEDHILAVSELFALLKSISDLKPPATQWEPANPAKVADVQATIGANWQSWVDRTFGPIPSPFKGWQSDLLNLLAGEEVETHLDWLNKQINTFSNEFGEVFIIDIAQSTQRILSDLSENIAATLDASRYSQFSGEIRELLMEAFDPRIVTEFSVKSKEALDDIINGIPAPNITGVFEVGGNTGRGVNSALGDLLNKTEQLNDMTEQGEKLKQGAWKRSELAIKELTKVIGHMADATTDGLIDMLSGAKGLGEGFKQIALDISRIWLRYVIDGVLKLAIQQMFKLLGVTLDFGSTFANLFGGIGRTAQAAGNTASAAANAGIEGANAGAGAASSVSSAAMSGALGWVGVGIQAVNAVFTALQFFQGRRMEQDIGRMEVTSRGLLNVALQINSKIDTYLPKLADIHGYLWQTQLAALNNISSALEGMRNGGGGNAPQIVIHNATFQLQGVNDPYGLLNQIARVLKMQRSEFA